MGRPALTTEEWIEKAKTVHGDTYSYDHSVYVGYGKLIKIACKEHGVFEQKENNHRNGAGCQQCAKVSRQKKRSHDYNSFVVKAKLKHNNLYEYPKQVINNSRSMVKITCPVHGEFQQVAYSHLNGQGCRKCGYEKNGRKSRLGMSEFLRRVKEVHGDTYEYLSGLSGLHQNIRILCQLHGEFAQTPANHLKGAGCPRCIARISAGEQELADFIAFLGLEFYQSDRSVIAPFEIDIFIPSKRVAIEYNGLWFHREELVGNKHREKWELCNKHGIKLIQIFEDEWKHKQEQVKRRLVAIFGMSDRVFARKCSLISPDVQTARRFLEEHHTQEAGTALSRSYGLEFDGELVALATFGKGRFNNSGWELLRYASKGRVVGGISRLVKAFRKDYPAGELISYADLRWGDGEAYKAAGFTLDCITEPDYWWADCVALKRHSRYQLQSHKTGIPEKDYAKENNLVKVLGVGHKRWRSTY